jgi:ankyrin repeat protein
LLLGAGANVNSETRAGLTPLHVAAIYGKVSVVRTLLTQASPKLDAPDQFGETPLHKAVALGNEEITQLLIMHGANVFKSQ